ncbi:MAG: polyprotein [Hangzhou dicistro-like virus 1]|nr:MAG: polyprotein [Hangzhou dicistro-like virus 1]
MADFRDFFLTSETEEHSRLNDTSVDNQELLMGDPAVVPRDVLRTADFQQERRERREGTPGVFRAVHPVAPFVDRKMFERGFRRFGGDIRYFKNGVETPWQEKTFWSKNDKAFSCWVRRRNFNYSQRKREMRAGRLPEPSFDETDGTMSIYHQAQANVLDFMTYRHAEEEQNNGEQFYDCPLAPEESIVTQGYSCGCRSKLNTNYDFPCETCYFMYRNSEQTRAEAAGLNTLRPVEASGSRPVRVEKKEKSPTFVITEYGETVTYNYPFSPVDAATLWLCYCADHPWFQKTYDRLYETYGETMFTEAFNRYRQRHQFYQGTMEHWHWVYFQTRRLRAEVVEFIDRYCTTPDAKRRTKIFKKKERLVVQGDEVLEATSSVSGEANITFVDERPVDTDSTHLGKEMTTSDPNKDLAEVPWNMNEILTREIPITRLMWTVSLAANKVIYEAGLPALLVGNKNSVVYSQLRLFAFGRYGVRLRIQLNGTKFHCGRLIAAVFPLMWKDDIDSYPVRNWVCLPHGMLDASVSNSVVLEVPFSHMLSHFPHRAGSLEEDSVCSLGRLRIAVLNPLRAGDGSSTVLYLSVFAQLVNPEMHQVVDPIERFSFGNGIVVQGDEGFFKGIFSRGLSTMLGSVLTKMTGGLALGVGDFLKGLIFDKPIDPMPAAPFVNRSVNAPCHGAGLDHSVRLSLSPISQTVTTEATLGGTAMDYNIGNLCSIPTLLQSVEWNDAMGPGTVLARVPVCPVYVPASRTRVVEEAGYVEYDPTMLAYVSRAFCYWRGSIHVKLQIVGTAFHSGRLAVIYDPSWVPEGDRPSDLDTLMMMNTIIVDVQEQQEIAIELPYMSVRPWLRCDSFRGQENFIPQFTINDMKLGQFANGTMIVVVLNGLVAPSNVASTIDMNVFVYGGPDFELAVPNSLDPLSLVPPEGVSQRGELQEYPFITPAIKLDPIEFENRDVILALYFEGRRMYEAGKLDSGPNWYQSTPTIWARDVEVLTWQYRASLLAQYTKVKPFPVQALLMNSLPLYHKPLKQEVKNAGVVQGLETYTTTRQNEVATVCITKGARRSEVAPTTLSENAMNLQTVMRRFYPLLVSVPVYTTSDFTLITVPVSPTNVPKQFANVGTAAESDPIHPISWFTRLYTYFRGSLRYKLITSNTNAEIYCWHVPYECLDFTIKPGMKESDVQKMMTFAGNISVTHLQAAMEVEVPFFSPYNQLLVDVHGKYKDLRSQNGTLFFAVRNDGKEVINSFKFSLFISTGDDYVVNIVKPPPRVFEAIRTYNNCAGDEPKRVFTPEYARNLGDDGQKVVVAGRSGFKELNLEGGMRPCVDLVTQGLEWIPFASTVKKVNDTLEAVTNTLHTVERHRVLQNFSTLAEKVEGIAERAEARVDDMPTQVLGATSSVIAKYSILTAEVVACGAVLYNIHLCLTEPSLAHFLGLAISVAAAVGLAVSNTLHELVQRVYGWVFKPEQAQAQALDGAIGEAVDSHAGVIAAVVAVIGTVFYAFMFGIVPSFDKMKTAIRKFFEDDPPAAVTQGLEDWGVNLRNAHFSVLGISALERVFNKISEYIHRFIDWILDKENPAVIAARASERYRERVLALIAELDSLEFEPTFIEALSSPFAHNRFYRMLHEAQELTKACVEEKLDARVVALVSECRKRAQRIIQRYEKDSGVPHTKYDPFVICLHGESGVGKTHMMHKIAEWVADEMKVSKYNTVYSKGIGDKYWSGYKNQPIVLWDEFAQDKEGDKKVGEFMTLRGNAPVLLNMSDNADKGRPFTSQCIIMTTNSPYIDFNTIRDNSAFRRRRHLMIGVAHRPGYNANVLQNARHDEFPNYEHAIFRRTDNMQETFIGDQLSWAQVQALVREKVRFHHEQQVAKLETEETPTMPRGVMPVVLRPGDEGYAEAAAQQDEVDANIRRWVVDVNHQGGWAFYDREREEPVDEEIDQFYDAETSSSGSSSESSGNELIGAVGGVAASDSDTSSSSDEEAAARLRATWADDPLGLGPGIFAVTSDSEVEDAGHIQAGAEDIVVARPLPIVVFRRTFDLELNDEETLMADLFVEQTYRMGRDTKYYIWRKVQQAANGASRLFELAKGVFISMKNKVVNFYEEHPKIAKCLGLLTLFGGVGLVMFMLKGREKKSEGAYESGPTLQPLVRVVPEGVYESGPVSRPGYRVVPEGVYESGPVTRPGVRIMQEGAYESGPTKAPAYRLVVEGAEDAQAMDIKRKVHPSIYPIHWREGSARAFRMKCLHIGGSKILLPFHFFSGACEGDQFVLSHRVNPVVIEFSAKSLVRLRDFDWVVYDCGPRLEPGKLLLKYFVAEKDLNRLGKTTAFLISVDASRGLPVLTEALCQATAIRQFRYSDPQSGDTYLQTGWHTTVATLAGDCGSVLVASNTQASPPGKLLGIHVAGKPGKNDGYSVLITRELISEAFNVGVAVLPPPVVEAVDRSKDPIAQGRIIPSGDYSIYGVLPNNMCPIQPMGTTFKETPFYEELGGAKTEPKKPAHLRPFTNANGERVSPLKKALAKYGMQTYPFPRRNLQKIEFYLKHALCDQLKHHTGKRVWGEVEAVTGLPGVKYADRLNMKSSPGWPYQILNKTASGKHYLFDEEGNIVDKELKRRLAERHEAAKYCQRVPSLWRDCMKDELRPVEKVDQGKTRLFNIAPVDFTILTRQYFMDFVMAFYAQNCNRFFSAVGMNPESFEWTVLYNWMAEGSKDAIAGDFSSFDGTIPPEVFEVVVNCINHWYGDSQEEANVRVTLFNEMIHTLQLVENVVYSTHQGNPSGNPLTVVINTMVNFIYILDAWIEIYPEKSVEDFFEECRFIAYGDDNLITVRPKAQKFNQSAITKVLEKYGITYTSETKTAEQFTFRNLDDLTFLKRGFRTDPEFGNTFRLPVMSEETLESYFYYYREADDVEEQLRENMRAGLLFAAFRGREFYDRYNEKWMRLMRSKNLRPMVISFDEWVDNFWVVCGLGGVPLPKQALPRTEAIKEASGTLEVEGMERFFRATNNPVTRTSLALLQAPLYYLCAALGIGSRPLNHKATDDRWAVSIPSGEGKSFLTRLYPQVFVDHDELLLKRFGEQSTKERLMSLPWSAAEARKHDLPASDRRILLVHHPENTNRQIIGSFITQFPTFIRTNVIQRLNQYKPKVMGRDERNAYLLQIAKSLEPSLFAVSRGASNKATANSTGLNHLSEGAEDCNATPTGLNHLSEGAEDCNATPTGLNHLSGNQVVLW